ncbi:MAG: glycine/betaine ABC transporter ATP-binding protein [Firmicutes bacterium HGW-Firmicutes-5]|nr:MAG: glycine/betaine ABC transporter ATP-binding protein [Firmicutes bacterium HGW-Firmicutes-5]
MGFIEFENVSKSYNSSEIVIDSLSLSIPEGEFVTILGPSGCGKTTLLKMVNKLIDYNSGSITVDHKDIQDWDTIRLRRSIGYVIQQIGLLPHLNIEDNINYVLNITKSDKKLRRGRAEELIELVGLSIDHLDRYPRELSGGQKQRVGVARALAADPKIILMDEPFGAVDEIARTALQDEILNIHNKLKKTILFVTHDIQEAIKLGSTIVLINEGKVEQVGTKEDLIFNPASDFVKEFFGIKGFQATLDKSILRDLYKRILTKEESIEDLYHKLES